VKPLWLLLPIPEFLARFAWFGWEYSGEAAPFAAAIAILGYGGLGTGTLLRRRLGVRQRG